MIVTAMIVTRENIDDAIALLGVAADYLINRGEPMPRIAAKRHIFGARNAGIAWELAREACAEVALREPRIAGTDLELLQAAHNLDRLHLPPGFLGIDFGEDDEP